MAYNVAIASPLILIVFAMFMGLTFVELAIIFVLFVLIMGCIPKE